MLVHTNTTEVVHGTEITRSMVGTGVGMTVQSNAHGTLLVHHIHHTFVGQGEQDGTPNTKWAGPVESWNATASCPNLT